MSDIFDRMAKEGLLPRLPTLDDVKEALTDDPSFETMNEQDQILYRQRQRLLLACKTHDYQQPKEEIARSFMIMEFGPKFTERVLADPECRRKLGID